MPPLTGLDCCIVGLLRYSAPIGALLMTALLVKFVDFESRRDEIFIV
jgi:hypothetical protein